MLVNACMLWSHNKLFTTMISKAMDEQCAIGVHEMLRREEAISRQREVLEDGIHVPKTDRHTGPVPNTMEKAPIYSR